MTDTWTERSRLVADDGVAVDFLGGSGVALDGDTIFLGASRVKVGLQQTPRRTRFG